MCYEYDWMQAPQADEELRKAQEKTDLPKQQTTAPPVPAEGQRREEPVTA